MYTKPRLKMRCKSQCVRPRANDGKVIFEIWCWNFNILINKYCKLTYSIFRQIYLKAQTPLLFTVLILSRSFITLSTPQVSYNLNKHYLSSKLSKLNQSRLKLGNCKGSPCASVICQDSGSLLQQKRLPSVKKSDAEL